MTTRQRNRGRPRGKAWHWKQTDCWYYTPPGTKRRVRLKDEDGKPVRGQDNRRDAELALARVKVARTWRPVPEPVNGDPWVVARVCSEYVGWCEKRVSNGTLNREYYDGVKRHLNDLCSYCGALPVVQLKKGHISHWIEGHESWRSPVTRRSVITTVLAAFNYAHEMYDVPNPLTGLKKPPQRPRLNSFSVKDEAQIYRTTHEAFRNFLFVAIHTGLRPFCELARITADEVIETDRGMMWRVYSSKTKKTRTIPVRPEVAALTRKLMATAPVRSGIPLLRNSQGNAWKKVTGVGRFLAIKRVLRWDQETARKNYSCYTARHTFAHRMLSGFWNNGRGCSIETLAELMGDTPTVAFNHYGKEWGQHYQEPLWAAIGPG